jgi:catechol 2,3-dioxygenase-like lactoylglutathione lyase family enzyme
MEISSESEVANEATCRNTGIHHVGLHATNPVASAEFYRDVLGMEIVGGSAPDHPLGASAFLSSRPNEESHEVALFANPAFAHIAFKVSSLAEFRSFHARVVEKNIPIKSAFNHRVSFAFYFDDPDGNMIEVYWPTGDLSWRQPQAKPLDLSQPDEVLLQQLANMVWAAGIPATLAGVTALFLLVALEANVVPSLRALAVDPIEVLRSEWEDERLSIFRGGISPVKSACRQEIKRWRDARLLGLNLVRAFCSRPISSRLMNRAVHLVTLCYLVSARNWLRVSEGSGRMV